MTRKSRAQSGRKLVLLEELAGDPAELTIAEQEDGIYLFRRRPPRLEIERLRAGESAGHPRLVVTLTPAHDKIEPQWLADGELVYLAERTSADGKMISGQAIYRAPTAKPAQFSRVAEYPLGCFHLVARLGAVRFFERIGTGHDAYYEDGFVAWDPGTATVTGRPETQELAQLPDGAAPTFPPCLHSFSHRQGDPTLTLASHRFSLRRLRAGNDATWALERAGAGAESPVTITGEHETVSCARLAADRLLYLRGPAAAAGATPAGENRLVCHLATDPASPIEASCGPAAAWRVSAGRASLFHVHGDLILVVTDRLRVFRLE